MPRNYVVFCTIDSQKAAQEIAEDLVKNRLAACVNIISDITSIYKWKGKLEHSEEHLMLVKTTKARLQQVINRIERLHTYEVPEVIALPIEHGHPPYLDWLTSQVKD